MRILILLALAALVACRPAAAQPIVGQLSALTPPAISGIAFEPSNPVAGQSVTVLVDNSNLCYYQFSASRNDRIITILKTRESIICPSAGVFPERMRFVLGPLPAGEYILRLAFNENATLPGLTSILAETVLVVAAASVPPNANYSGMWSDPSAPGWGIGFIQSSSGQAFATLYAYDNSGKPVWFGVPGGIWSSPSRFEGTMYATTAASSGIVVGNSSIEAVGRMSLQFNGQGSAVLRYVVYAGIQPYSGSRGVAMLAF